MAAPNIVNVSTIYGKTVGTSITTTASVFLQNNTSSGLVYKLNTIMVSNVNGTNNADITIEFLRGGVTYDLASTITVPADASIVILSKENPIYLEEGDAIRTQASVNSYLQAICSYEELS